MIEPSRFRRALLISLILHSLLFLSSITIRGCSGGGDSDSAQQQDKAPKNQPTPEDIAEKMKQGQKDDEVEVDIVNIPAKPKPKHADDECPSGRFYGGIGIYERTSNLDPRPVVVRAVPGYPGADIGLEAGDIILSPDKDIKGEVGTSVELIVQKVDGSVLTFTVIRDKICLEDKKP